ncbi:DUF2254 domain-containing protein [Bythopirellula goksoeyrii]|uniref:DUF2254 domain-containing protein n=1 Tax=Bythopirellula goksoeyrii TaxID=1400387 RepID=A0A5B9QGC1_9BACT|nr:DUF2254 domain-containing protein [Bythopirellula goksoeyrii]QEG36949.1 hypothetical protein Pr1d_42890 [Bythopirellula goksoeyrii]
MRTWLVNLWDNFRSGFWFIPSLLTLLAFVLGFTMPEVDRYVSSSIPAWMHSSPETARATLTTLAGAMITAAGLVFSVTIVALSITSSQFGPRLLRNFLSDSITQLALGACLATSLYSLLLLTAFSHSEDTVFLPFVSIYLALLFALVTLYILIYCLHRVASATQADNVVAEVAEDLEDSISRIFPENIGEKSDDLVESEKKAVELFSERSPQPAPVEATKEGYLQAVDFEGIIGLAKKSDLVIKLISRPGDFLMQGIPIAEVQPGTNLDEEVQEKLNKTLIVGNRRTTQQDMECAVSELVEVAVRALSPGINDPFTAIRCVDRLGAMLRRLAKRDMPVPYRLDEEGNLRVIARGYTFPNVLDCAFDQIRQHSSGTVSVSLRLLESLEKIALCVDGDKQKAAVLRQAEMIYRGCVTAISEENDRDDLAERYWFVLKALGENPDDHEPFSQDWKGLSSQQE